MKALVLLFVVVVSTISYGQQINLYVDQQQSLNIQLASWPTTASNWKWEIFTGSGGANDRARLFWVGVSQGYPDEWFIDHRYHPNDYSSNPNQQIIANPSNGSGTLKFGLENLGVASATANFTPAL